MIVFSPSNVPLDTFEHTVNQIDVDLNKNMQFSEFFLFSSANLEDLVVGESELNEFLLLDETLRIFTVKDGNCY